ncbi:serine hydrolase domain-containing protein [Bacillus carboniphilus]|uniref:Serine hydrolase domain-containing protein n=1 Tax=Bacillus carboniphilus TaxID=86663 RepID=A0ABP3G7H5_9BACI
MKKEVLSFLQREVQNNHIPGAVLHVSFQGEVLLQEAVGNKVVSPEKSPMGLDTIFDLASLTKVVATLPAVLKLLDHGLVRLDDRVSYFLPEFGKAGKEEIRIRHLLTHTGGLPAFHNFYLESLTTEQIMDRIYEQELIYPIGSKVIYSDLGLITLYKLIEAVTEQAFPEFLKKEIYEPLKMLETGFNPTYPRERFAATEYCEHLNGYKQGIVHDENTESMGGISGHAGLFSTVTDLANFTSMIENDGVFNGKQILSSSALELSRKNFTAFDSEYRGLGWILNSPCLSSCGDYFSDTSYGHTGFTGTSIWFDPKVKLHVILLTNRVHFGRKDHILRLRPRLHNLIRANL